ncbi:MAG: hypothetical protein ACR2OH_11865 [Microthrixaceae bacterium]
MADQGSQRRADVMGRWLPAIEDALAAGPGSVESSDTADPVRVDAHLAAAECPAGHLAPQDDFRDSARAAAREIALETLRRHRDGAGRDDGGRNPSAPARDAIAEVASTLCDTTIFRPGLGEWLDQLDRAERAAVTAAAASWMVDALALTSRNGEPHWHGPGHRLRKLRSAPVTIAARVDASRRTRSGIHLLVLSPGARGTDARLARRIALVTAAAHGEVPVEVHIGHRDTLARYRHPIDDAELDSAVVELTDDAGWRLKPSTAPRHPGRSCRWCTLAENCPEGTQHLAATKGAPIPPWLVDAAQSDSGDGGDPTM